MTDTPEQNFPFHPSEADCADRAKYWREVARDPRTNEATRVVARKQELAWLQIGMNIADLNRADDAATGDAGQLPVDLDDPS